MYDVAVFANRSHDPLTMSPIRVLIWLSRFIQAHIAYVIDTDKIIAAFFRISYCLLDLIRYNSIVRHVQTKKIYDDAVFSDRFRYQLHMFRIRVLIWLS